MAGVAFVTDSGASLPAPLAARLGIEVVPLQVLIDGEPVADVPGSRDVVAALREGRGVTTSQPTVADARAAVDRALASGADEVVLVAMSRELSGTAGVFDSLADGERIHAVACETIGPAQGLLVAAAALARPSAAAEATALVSAGTASALVVDDLGHLRRGGRLGALTHAAASLTGVKPVLEVRDGRIVQAGVKRSRRAAWADAVARACDGRSGDGVAVVVTAIDDPAAQDETSGLVARALPGAAVVHWPLSAAVAAHLGPGALGVSVAQVGPELVAALAASSA